jgi:hypothetical protein
VILSAPRHGDPITADGKTAGRQMQKFIDDLRTLPFGEISVTESGTVGSGAVSVDCTAGDVTLTIKSFPVTIFKADASINSVIIGGMTVNGNPAFSWNTQYQAYTIYSFGLAK